MDTEVLYDDPWYTSWELINARAWWLLERSCQVPPRLSRLSLPCGPPRFRLWNDAMGFDDGDPTTLTVFEPWTDTEEASCLVREAIWRRTPDLTTLSRRARESGKTVYMEPTISVRDGRLSRCRVLDHLQMIAAVSIPVISIDNGGCVTTDVGSCGFEFLSRDQPTASIRLQWSDRKPDAWSPVVDEINRLRDRLRECLG